MQARREKAAVRKAAILGEMAENDRERRAQGPIYRIQSGKYKDKAIEELVFRNLGLVYWMSQREDSSRLMREVRAVVVVNVIDALGVGVRDSGLLGAER